MDSITAIFNKQNIHKRQLHTTHNKLNILKVHTKLRRVQIYNANKFVDEMVEAMLPSPNVKFIYIKITIK